MVYNVYANVIMLIDEIEGRNKDKEIQKLALSPNSRQELKGKCKTQVHPLPYITKNAWKVQLSVIIKDIINNKNKEKFIKTISECVVPYRSVYLKATSF